MANSIVRYTGSFSFTDRPVLERALMLARSRIDAEAELSALEGGWLRCFQIRDTTLTVQLALDAVDRNRVAATEVFALLSREALEGSVIASIDDVPVEYYSVRPWAVA